MRFLIIRRAEAPDWVRRRPEADVELGLCQVWELSDFALDQAETPDELRDRHTK